MPEFKKDLFADIFDEPKEHYTFEFNDKYLPPVEKKYLSALKKRMFIYIIPSVIIILIGLKSPFILGFGIGLLLLGVTVHVKTILATKKNYAKVREKYSKTILFDYTLYSDCLIVSVFGDTAIRQLKAGLHEIKNVHILADTVILEIDGQLFLMKKDELIENSYFLMRCAKN